MLKLFASRRVSRASRESEPTLTRRVSTVCDSFFSNIHTTDGLITFTTLSGGAEIVRQVGAERWSLFIDPDGGLQLTVILFLRGATEYFEVRTPKEAAISYENWVRELYEAE